MSDAVWLKRVLPNATVTCRSNNRQVQARLCAGGAGLAVLPRPLDEATTSLVAFTLDEPPLSRDTSVGYHRDLAASTACVRCSALSPGDLPIQKSPVTTPCSCKFNPGGRKPTVGLKVTNEKQRT